MVNKTSRRAAGLLFVLGSVVAAGAPALACDSTSCLMLTRGTAGLLSKGGFQFDVSYRYADVSAKREGTDSTDLVIRPKVFIEQQRLVDGYHQDESAAESFLQLDTAWGATSRATVFASIPLFTRRTFDVTHFGFDTSYNPHGIGDLLLGARFALWKGPERSLVAGLGFKLPTGTNDLIDIFDGTILDPTMQPGTGAGDFISSLQWSMTAGKAQVSLSGSYQVNTTNDFNYRFGNEALGAVTVSRAYGRFSPSFQVKLWNRPRSIFVDEPVPSTGGTIVYLNGGLRFQSADRIGVYAFLLVPGYRNVNDAQLAPRYSMVIGVSKTF